MVEGWVGTGVEARGVVGGCGVGVGGTGNFDGHTSTGFSRPVMLMVENWELKLIWVEVWVTGMNDGPISSKAQ